jgi:hypothetical protein
MAGASREMRLVLVARVDISLFGFWDRGMKTRHAVLSVRVRHEGIFVVNRLRCYRFVHIPMLLVMLAVKPGDICCACNGGHMRQVTL